MRRLVATSGVLVLVLGLAVAAPVAGAADGSGSEAVAAKKKKSPTTVTAELFHFNDGEIIEGSVDGTKSFCDAEFVSRPVQVYRENGATDELVAETEARVDPPPFGFFETDVLPPQPSGTQFYAVAPKDKVTKRKICLEGVSPVVTVP